MAQITDANGNTTIRQGDTFYIVLEDIDSTLGGKVYIQVIDENRKPIFTTEPSVSILGLTEATITIPASQSDLLTVKRGNDFAEYQYAVKHVKDGVEDTWFLGDNRDFGELPVITVYPKVVEGE